MKPEQVTGDAATNSGSSPAKSRGRLSRIGRELIRLRDFFDAPLDATATPLEIGGAILDDLEGRIQPIGGGRRAFPYDRITIRVKQRSENHAAVQAVLDGLNSRLIARLEELRCEFPSPIEMNITTVDGSDEWPCDSHFSLECARTIDEAVAVAAAPVHSALAIAVLKGTATSDSYRFNGQTVCIGRTEEATDALGRVRRNDVAFVDVVDGVNETVGRAHARFRFDRTSGGYRVFDDGSRNGTWVERRGTTIAVPVGDPRGVRLESGDEIRFGRALIRVLLEA
jgi:FHA domain-containing protein